MSKQPTFADVIQEAFAPLIAAITENTAAVNALNEGRAESLAAIKGVSEKPAAKPAAKPKAAEADEEKPATKPAPKRKAAAKKPKAPSLDDLLNAFGDFMKPDREDDMSDDEYKTVVDDRIDFVLSITQEFGVGKVREIAEEDRERALGYLADKLAGRKVDFGADDSDEGDSLL